MERWALCVGCLLLFAASLAAGWFLGKRGKKVASITIASCLGFLLVRALFRFTPALEFALLPFETYAIWRPWWAIPFGLITLGAGAPHMSTELAKKGLLVFGVGLWLVSAQRLVITALFDPSELTGVVRRDGVCQQTTGYTCGAAAAATLLAHYGIAADEREMAERCWTNALTGTDQLCVARGLRQKIAGTGRRVAIATTTYDELVTRGEPAMVTIRWSFLIDHWVVVLEANPERAIVGDPLHGLQKYTRAQFLEKYRGVTVTLER